MSYDAFVSMVERAAPRRAHGTYRVSGSPPGVMRTESLMFALLGREITLLR